jgi:hypothetical protein
LPPSRAKAEQGATSPQVDDGAFEHPKVHNHIAGAGGTQRIGGVAAGVACAGETDHRHSGNHTSGHADW